MSTKVKIPLPPEETGFWESPPLSLPKILADGRENLCPCPPRKDLTGHWIWLPQAVQYQPRNSYVYFRKRFTAQGIVKINIAADTFYDLFMDGVRIDRGTAPSDVEYKIFDSHMFSVSAGEHVLAVLVHHLGQACATAMKSQPGLYVEITGAKGDRIATDGSWKVLPARAYEQDLPCMMSHFGFYEVCDCRKIPQRWREISCDDSNWYDAEILGGPTCKPWVRMIPRDIPLLQTESIQPVRVLCRGRYQQGPLAVKEPQVTIAVEMASRKRIPTGANLQFPIEFRQDQEYVVFDFGQEVVGHVQLQFQRAAQGQRVDIAYDEILDANGFVNPRRTYVHFADRYYLHKDQQELEVFNARGFRYLMIDLQGTNEPLTLVGLHIEQRTYPIGQEGQFECSDKELESLYQTGLRTTRLCMLDTYVDCPSRERVMWMDSYLEGLCSSYAMGVTALWRRGLYLFAQNVCKEGLLAGVVKGFAPCDADSMLLLSYVAFYVCSVADYLLHSGDFEAAARLYPTVQRQLEILARYSTAEGLLNDQWPSEAGTFIDWSAMDWNGISAANNAIYIKALRKTAILSRHLGHEPEALQYVQNADRLAQVFQEAFWSPAEGVFMDVVRNGRQGPVRSQATNVLAIWAGIVNEKTARAILQQITNPEKLAPRTPGDFRLKKDFHCQTEGIVPLGTPALGSLMAEVMFRVGWGVEALHYLKENWKGLDSNSTFAEHFIMDANTSFCQGWSAGPVILLPRFILGVKPLRPGWELIEVNPQVAGLQWAQGTVPTPKGNIEVSWRKQGESLDLSVKVPDGISVIQPGRK